MKLKKILAVSCAFIIGISAFSLYRAKIEPVKAQANTIEYDQLIDKLEGAWLGAFWANWTGLPTEFKYVNEPGPEGSVKWVIGDTFATDDDTSVEYTFLHMMEVYGVNDITYADMPAEWLYHLQDYIWEGNYYARTLMSQGFLPPETGKFGLNQTPEAIDAQIECEILGMVTPGMLQNSYDRTKWWMASVGDGVVLENSAFYAMLCSNAFFEDDILKNLQTVRSYFDDSLTTAKMYDDVLELYESGVSWREARKKLHQKYYTGYVLDCRINFVATILALLYGEGDYKETVEIAILCGYDNDCNAATSGTILGIQYGKKGLPQEFLDRSGDWYQNTNRAGLTSASVNTIAQRIAKQAEEVILSAGGIKNGKTYTIYDANFVAKQNDEGYSKQISSDDKGWTYNGMSKFFNADYLNNVGYGSVDKNATAEYVFTGDRVAIAGVTSVNGGKIKIEIDGKDYGIVDISAEQTFVSGRSIAMSYNQIYRKIRGLGEGQHTLKITTLEQGKWHTIDYIEVECSEDEYYASENLNLARTKIATPIASINGAIGTGSGSGALSVIRDGVYYTGGHSSTQYDTYLGRDGAGGLIPHDFEDYVGYTFSRSVDVKKLIFNEGGHWGTDGGWFANGTMRVEVLVDGEWINVNYQITPSYPNSNTLGAFGAAGEVFEITFDKINVEGVRIIGMPGGNNKLISCGELEVY